MPECVELQRNTSQRGLLIASYQRLKKDSDRAITPTAEAVRIPEHLVPPSSLKAAAPHSCSTLAGEELPQAKKNLASMHMGLLQLCPTLRPCGLWTARLLCQGVLQARILECIGQYWLP